MMNLQKHSPTVFCLMALALLLASSCTGIDSEMEVMQTNDVSLGHINLAFSTKSDGEGVYSDTTFRFCLFNPSTHNFSGYEGTYCSPNPSKDQRWLTPCKVDDSTGAYDSADSDPEATKYGLRAANGTYSMVIASPAVAVGYSEKGKCGFYYERERTPGEKVLCVSDDIEVKVSGTNIDGSNLYFVNDTIRLKERRSKLKLSVSCGDDIESAKVKGLRIENILTKGYYLPVDRAFDYEDSDLGNVPVETLTPAITLYKEYNPEAGQPKHHQCDLQPYVLSMDYSQVDSYGIPLYALPELIISMGEDGGTEVRIPIAYNLLPENIYKCHITINSCFVEVRLSVLEWDGPNNVSGDNSSFLQRPMTFTVPIWENGTPGTSGETEIHDSEW